MNSDPSKPDLAPSRRAARTRPAARALAAVHCVDLAAPWHPLGRERVWVARARRRAHARGFATDRPIDAFPAAELDARAAAAGAAIVDTARPIALAPATVAKPWGREIWHSGFERRGVAHVTDGRHATKLPWALALLGVPVGERLPLVKVLEPHHVPVVGELYFEVHDEKHEVYVVVDVDRRAWPDGVGALRFGMDQAQRARRRDDARFRADYVAAVHRYRHVRDAIDAGRAGAALEHEERERRAAMDAFVSTRALRVGDVVYVPPGVPHGLAHGVRVVEIQTPVFERKILSFAQRVQTQPGWDTDEAVASMRLDAPSLARAIVLHEDDRVRIERLAACPEFDVLRARLAAGAAWQLPASAQARVCIALGDALALDAVALGRERACLVPAHAGTIRATNAHARDARELLIAGRGAASLASEVP